MNKIITLFLLLYLSTNVISQDEGGIIFRNDLDSAFYKAKKENKLIFLYIYVSDCEACDWLAKNFRNKSLSKLYNKYYRSYSLDADGSGKDIASDYGVIGFPTLLYLTPEGEVKYGARGYRDGKSIFEIGKLARLSSRQIKKTMERTYKSDPNNIHHLYDYIEYQFITGRYSKVDNLLKEYLAQKDKIEKVSWMNLVLDYASDPKSYANDVLIKEKDQFISLFGEQYINETIWNSLINRVSEKQNASQIKRFEQSFIEEVQKAGYDPKDDRLILFYSNFLFSGDVLRKTDMPTSDMAIFTKYALEAINIEEHIFDQEHLISIAVHLIAFYQQEEVLNKLFDVLETNFTSSPNHSYLDLQSVILYILGKEEASISKIVEARELALSQGYVNFKPSISVFKKLEVIK